MKKYFSSPKILVIDLEPEDLITSSDIGICSYGQDDDSDDSQKAHSRGGIWDDM